jgi:hypothetical protein
LPKKRELCACEPVGGNDPAAGVGFGLLENGLCKIDRDGCSIHAWTPFVEDLIPTPMKTSAPTSREKREESTPSVKTRSPVLSTVLFGPPAVNASVYA